MTEIDQWKNDLQVYNDEYEGVALKIRQHTNEAFVLLRTHKPTTKVADIAAELSRDLQRLVEARGTAAYNYRGVKNFYEATLIRRKHEIMRNGEKKIAAGVAEGEAVIASHEEFALMNEAQMYADVSDKRFSATETLIESLHLKLQYGYQP